MRTKRASVCAAQQYIHPEIFIFNTPVMPIKTTEELEVNNTTA
jgi:hypothetical protein